MMGRESPPQAKLFYTDFSLEARIRTDHPLRRVVAAIDFDFVYAEVADRVVSKYSDDSGGRLSA